MKITVIILSVLVAQVSASFFDEFHGAVFSVKSSVGKLFYDVVTDFADTVDCTILAVKHVLSDKTSPRYNQKCNGDKARESATSSYDRENVKVYTPALDTTLEAIYKNKQNFKEDLLQHVDAPVSEDVRRTQIKTNLENVQNLVKDEADRLGAVSSQSRQIYEDINQLTTATSTSNLRASNDKTDEAMDNVEQNLNTTEADINSDDIKTEKAIQILVEQVKNNTKANAHPRTFRDVAQQIFTQNSLSTNQLQSNDSSIEINKGVVKLATQKPDTTKEVRNSKSASHESLVTNQWQSNAGSTEMNKGLVVLNKQKPNTTKDVHNPKSGSEESLSTNQFKSNADSTEISKGQVILTTQKPDATKEVNNPKSGSNESIVTNHLQSNAGSTDINKGLDVLTTQKPDTTAKEVSDPKSGSEESIVTNQLQSNAGSTEINKGLVVLNKHKPNTIKDVHNLKSGSEVSLATNQLKSNADSTEISKGQVILTTQKPDATKEVDNPKSGSNESIVTNQLQSNAGSTDINKGLDVLTTQKPDSTTKEVSDPKSGSEESLVTNQLQSNVGSTEINKEPVVLNTRKQNTTKEVSNSKSGSVGLPATRTTQKPDETKEVNNPESGLEESFITNQLHSNADSTEMIKGIVVLTTKKPDTTKEVSNSKSESEDSHSFFNLAPNDREATEQARKLIEESRRSDMIMNNILKNAKFASSLFDSPDLLAFGK